jgi:phosphoenolpyruvate-protein phosphotransferase
MTDEPSLVLLAPVSGILVPLADVPDDAFAQRLVGDGVSIDPLSDTVVAPCDARVLMIHRAGHALTLEASGLEIVIHVGLDTVALNGEGFTALVQAGGFVKTGDPLLRFDADLVGRRAKSLLTEMIVTNMERVAGIESERGRVTAGRDCVMRVRLAVPAVPVGAPGSNAELRSGPLIVRCETGLHARPAAVLASTARRFAAELEIERNGKRANLRSVVSIMALEVANGDAVSVFARGDDAAHATAAIRDVLERGLEAPVAAAPSLLSTAHAASDDSTDILRGVPAAPGVALGNVIQWRFDDHVAESRAADPLKERRALDAAIATAQLQLEETRVRLTADADAERAAIFAAHQELLQDPDLLRIATTAILDGSTAAWGWRTAYYAQVARLESLKNPVLAGRATDMRDAGRRVLHLLVGRADTPRIFPPDTIIVAEEITPSDIASFDRARVRGLCSTSGSATSHVAILARGMALPAIAGADARVLALDDGVRVVLDGDAGTLRVAPTAQDEADFASRYAAFAARRATDLSASSAPATTRDGHRIEVAANIGNVTDASEIAAVGGEGIGLLRSEFLFHDREAAPDESEQTELYGAAVRAVGTGQRVIIRTLDVGGDKPLAYFPMAAEANPFLGERGIRFTLARPELFRTQVRAILRASQHGRVAVMFPMIAALAEWEAAKHVVESERAALGLPRMEIGIMVETAAAALMAERFARDADFFSIGTNDLTQYTMAMDRGNPRLASQMDALHPAVLRLIYETVAGAAKHGRWVGVCGAMAGDAAAIPVLLGLGVTELSVDIPLVPAAKARIRELDMAACRETASAALDAADAQGVRELVRARHGDTA